MNQPTNIGQSPGFEVIWFDNDKFALRRRIGTKTAYVAGNLSEIADMPAWLKEKEQCINMALERMLADVPPINANVMRAVDRLS